MNVQPNQQFSSKLPVCYELKLYLGFQLNRLAAGEIMEFISDDPAAEAEILPWLDLRGDELIEMQHLGDNQARFLIRRSS